MADIFLLNKKIRANLTEGRVLGAIPYLLYLKKYQMVTGISVKESTTKVQQEIVDITS